MHRDSNIEEIILNNKWRKINEEICQKEITSCAKSVELQIPGKLLRKVNFKWKAYCEGTGVI
jgi:hypothetical protein